MIRTFFHRDQPMTRHIANVSFWLLLCLAVTFWLGKLQVPDRDTEWFLGYMAVLSAGLLLVPTIMMRLPRFRDRATASIVGFYEFLAVLGLAAAWAGSFGLYLAGFGYDTFIHFFSSALFAYILVDAIVRAFPGLVGQWWKVWVVVILLGMAGGVGNELFEWGGDQLFGTKMFGKVGVPHDTAYDLVADAAGVLVGIAFAKRRKGWL
jgi:uncharacterized membrane protein YhaH (DUF805 family)